MSKKNFRKVALSTLAASAAAVSIVPAASAATETPFSDVNRESTGDHYESIIALTNKGIITGREDGTFAPFENVMRSQVALMLQRALDLKVPANKAEELKKYKDINNKTSKQVSDAVAAVSSAGVFTGSNGYFSPWKDMSREQMATTLVRAFKLKELDNGSKADVNLKNVSDAHKDAVQTIANLGITKEIGYDENGKRKDFRPYEPISRQQFASFVNRTQEIAAGFKVASVQAENNKEVTLAFNKPVDITTAQKVDNYKLTATDGSAAQIDSVGVQEDGKTVVLTLNKAASNQDKYKLAVSNVKDKSGNVVKTETKDLQFFDKTPPTAKDVTVTAPRTVAVNFSEPMKTAPEIKLDNGSISSKVNLASDGRSATVEFGVEPQSGAHKLELSGGSDYAGLRMEKTEKAFDYTSDKTAPTVSVSKADTNSVTLKFSKPVKLQNAGNVSIYHTVNNSDAYKGSTIKPVSPNGSGYSDTYTADFNTPIPEGNAKVFLNTKADALIDGWGNSVETATLNANVTVDREAPKVTAAEAVSDKKIELTFNKDVKAGDVQSLSNYMLKDASGNALSDKDYNFLTSRGVLTGAVDTSYDADSHKATLTLPSALKGGNYTLSVMNITDTSGNKLDSQDIGLNVKDQTPWDLAGDAVLNGNKLRIKFNEPMSTDGLTDLSKYELRGDAGKVDFPANTQVSRVDDRTVEITMGDAPSATPKAVRVSGSLKDAAGNRYSELYKETSITAATGPALVAESGKTIAPDKLQFQVDQELKGNLSPADFRTEGKTYGQASYENANGKSTVTLTLSTNSDKFAADEKPSVAVAENALVSANDTVNKAITVSAKDGIAPMVTKGTDGKLDITSTQGTNSISINFSEALATASNDLAGTDLVLKDESGKTLRTGYDYSTNVAGNTVTITLNGNYDGYKGIVNVGSKQNPSYIQDLSGNEAVSFAGTDVEVK